MATKKTEAVAEPTIKDLLLYVLNDLTTAVESGEISSKGDLKRSFIKALNS